MLFKVKNKLLPSKKNIKAETFTITLVLHKMLNIYFIKFEKYEKVKIKC